MNVDELVAAARSFHPWDAMTPAALEGLLRRGPFDATAETGCGGSTIILSHASAGHVAFAIEGENRTIAALRAHAGLRAERVRFVEGETRRTLPGYRFDGPLDLVLLDGPHAYPLPQLEYVYLFPALRVDGWLVLDDLQIPSVHALYRFLRREPEVELEQLVGRTAFFRRVREAPSEPDGWQRQGINRRPVWRYAWRDKLRERLGRA